MAKALAELNRKQQARKKAGMKGLTDLAGTAISFIPGVGPIAGKAVKVAGSLMAGDAEGAAKTTQSMAGSEKKEESSDRDKKLDEIMKVLKQREQPVPTMGQDLTGTDMLSQLRPQEDIDELLEDEEDMN